MRVKIVVGNVLAINQDLAARGLVQLDDGLGQGGFPAAGFPDNAQHLATGNRQADAIDRMDNPAWCGNPAAGKWQPIKRLPLTSKRA